MSSITASQVTDSLLAIPAFLPATFCTGYIVAWLADLYGFRQRAMVQRVFWSIPLSLALSTITLVLIGRFFSVNAAAVFLLVCALVCAGIFVAEIYQLRRAGKSLVIGWRPWGTVALLLACAWIAVAVLSLVDFGGNHRLFMSVTVVDIGSRVNWTQSILRTGVPPANPQYWYGHAASLRQYYFWYVVCAVVARLSHLPVRAVFTASSVWAGFGLAALTGLYLRHFLLVGGRLRRQFLVCVSLLLVTGLDIVAVGWITFHLHKAIPLDFEWWSSDQIASWMDSLLWVPHHIAGLLGCMLAFLLAWMSGRPGETRRVVPALLIAAALASAFGLSIYVAFGFFLVMLAWGAWQITLEHHPRPVWLLGAGGALAAVLLLPYLWELTHAPSYMQGGSLFTFAVREIIPPNQLLASSWLRHVAVHHPSGARNLANLILLLPGYLLDLGFYLVVLLIFLVPAWRGRIQLDASRRSLLFICLATLPIITFVRSSVIEHNDFGWRAALLLQFPLLLLASDLLCSWSGVPQNPAQPATQPSLRRSTPGWLRMAAALTLMLGAASTAGQLLTLRFGLPLVDEFMRRAHNPNAGKLPHDAWISAVGYSRLDPLIPRNAIVQYNPAPLNAYFAVIDQMSIDHQTVIAGDRDGCGSTLGGDPHGCPIMAAQLDALFRGDSANQARSTCRQFGIQYLVARIYDPAWNDPSGWVWRLPPVVSDPEFRVLACAR